MSQRTGLATLLVCLSLLPGCADLAAAPVMAPSAVSVPVALPPVSQPEAMNFPFPFRGVKYRMDIVEGQRGQPGRILVTADQPLPDEGLAKTAADNACQFIGRFFDSSVAGSRQPDGRSWILEAACL